MNITQNDICWLIPIILSTILFFSFLKNNIFYEMDSSDYLLLQNIIIIFIGVLVWKSQSCFTSLIGLSLLMVGGWSVIITTYENNDNSYKLITISIVILLLLGSIYKTTINCFSCVT